LFGIAAKNDPVVAANFDPRRLTKEDMANDWQRVTAKLQMAVDLDQTSAQINTLDNVLYTSVS
jgi:hypothetical protein